MEEQRLCGARVERLPSLTGGDAGELETYLPPLPSRQRALEQLREALEEMEHSPEPMLVLLVAEWGEGKTSLYNARIRPALASRGWRLLEARAATVIEHLRALRGRPERSPAARLLAAVLAAAAEQEGLLARIGAPEDAAELRGYIAEALREAAGDAASVLVFIDEMEDIVAGAGEEELAELAAGLLGVVNGEIRGLPVERLHLAASLTPPAYSKLMGLRDFATIAARLKRRIRVIWLPPLSRRESLAVLESIARYSLGTGVDGVLADHGLANAVASSSLGNMGALVSAFRYLASLAATLGRERGCPGGRAARLRAGELLEALAGLTLSVGGTELPAVNREALQRLMEGWLYAAEAEGFPVDKAARLMEELVARGAAGYEELEDATGLPPDQLDKAAAAMNLYAERGWLRRELGVRRLAYRVNLSDAVEDAFKLLRASEPEIVKLLPQLAGDERRGKPLEQLLDSLVYTSPTGRQVIAVPTGPGDAADLAADASPVELGRAEAERLGRLLWDHVFSRLPGGQEQGLLLSPRVQRLIYVSPELGYLDFIADRVERLQVVRRVYAGSGPGHLAAGAVAVLAAEDLVAEPPVPQGEAARLVLRLPGGAAARALLAAVPGQVGREEARRIEAAVSTALLSGWRPQLVLLVHQGGVDPEASRLLEALEAKLFLRVVPLGLQSLVSRVKLQALGVKLLEAAGGLEEALALAARLPGDRRLAERLGLDPLRLGQVLREIGEELDPARRIRRSLEEGVDGAPLLVRDPRLGYDVEKPTELAGALRYFLVAPSSKTSAAEALRAAYEYVLRYHLPRGAGGEARGILSPDIDQGEVGTLEKYMLLLAANGFLEKLNGKARVDTLAPMERSVLRALEQLGARAREVQASEVWNVLVVEARNPGTRRMLLQSLAYRGLIEAQGRRIDPDRSKIRLRDTPADAAALIQRAEELLEKIRGDPVAAKWGAIAAAKARAVRGGTLEALAAKMERLLETARQAHRAGELLMSLRLAKTALDTLSYAEQELLPLAHEAARKAAELRAGLREMIEQARQLRRAAEELLEQLTGAEVKLETPGLEAAEEALKRLEKLEDEAITEEQLDHELAEIMARARARNPRRPGEETPFYIHGTGPALSYNYKLYLAARILEETGAGSLGPQGPRLDGKPAQTLAKLEKLAQRLQEILEEAAEAKRLWSEIAERLRRHGAQPPPAPRLLDAPAGETLDPDQALSLAERAAAALEAAKKPLDTLKKILDNIEERLAEAEKLHRTLETLAAEARQALAEAKAANDHTATRILEETLQDIHQAEAEAKAIEEKARARLAAAPPDTTGLAEALTEAKNLLDSATLILNDTLSQAQRRLREAKTHAEAEAEKLLQEANSLHQALTAVGETPPPPPQPEPSPWRTIAKTRSYIEKLQETALAKGLLTREELQAYKAITEERTHRTTIPFREAVQLVAKHLAKPPTEAKKILLNLIDKGVLEPHL